MYDYLFYISRKSPINYEHLKNRLIDSGYLKDNEIVNAKSVKEIILDRFEQIDFMEAKNDILPFIYDKNKIDVWNRDLFVSLTNAYFN